MALVHTMFNTFYIFTLFFLFFGLLSIFVFFKSPALIIVLMECLVIVTYLVMVYMSSVVDDPRLALCAIFILFLASVEVVYFILYFSRV